MEKIYKSLSNRLKNIASYQFVAKLYFLLFLHTVILFWYY